MIFVAVIFSVLYFILLLWFLTGWLKLKPSVTGIGKTNIRFSIIVPARNEEANILNTIEDLAAQEYPLGLFEVIIIDDCSSDRTLLLAGEKIRAIEQELPNFRLISVNDDINYTSGHKKRALEKGISLANHEWILTTDADCRRGKSWLASLAGFIEQHKPVMVSGPVAFHNESTFFQKIQSLEFLSLVGIGAASIGNKSPNLCNGANLAYLKSAFKEAGGFSDNIELSSGDDEFLMHKIAALYPERIRFLKNKDAIVFTEAHVTLHEFLQQRKRWVSKSTKYRKADVFVILLFVYVFHLLILGLAMMSFFSLTFLLPFLVLLGSKIISEGIFVIPITRFFGKLKWMPLYPLAAILYVVYVSSIGVIGNSGSYLWKDRKVK